MQRRARCALTGTLIWLTGISSNAWPRSQENPCLERTAQLSVMTAKGQMVKGLNPSQFAAFYHGRSVRLLSLTQDQLAPRVLILLDASGSMQPVRKFTFDVAKELLSDLPEGAQVASVIFAGRAVGNSSFTTDRKAVQVQLEGLRNERGLETAIGGETALLETIQESLKMFGRPQDGDSLYVISDGDDNRSKVDWRNLTDQIVQSGIRVFAMRIQWIERPADSENHLQDIVMRTGGISVKLVLSQEKYFPTSAVLLRDKAGKPTGRAGEIALQSLLISNGSKMLIELPESAYKKLDWWELRLSDPKLLKGALLFYQHQLPACSIETLSH